MIDKNKIVYTFKKSFHISYNQDYFCCVGSEVNLYNINNGELVATFKDIKHPSFSKFTSNQNLVVKSTTGSYHIYDLLSMELIKIIPPPKKVLGSTTDFQLTSDNKYIIDFSYVFPTNELMVIEIETGECTFFNLGYSRRGYIFSTEIDSKYYVVSVCAETIHAPDVSIREFYELIYTSDKFELKKIYLDSYSKLSTVDYCFNKFVVADYSNKIKIFNIHKNFHDEIEYSKAGVLYDLKISKNGQFLALVESRNIYVYDLNKKECIRNYEVEYGCFVDFFDNDTKLLIGTWKKWYCIALE